MGSVRYYRVRNWGKFQHYKDRNPPWIKLYIADLLNDQEFWDLPDPFKVQLLCCFRVAAMWDNRIPDRMDRLEPFNRSFEPMNLAALVEAGFLELCEEEAKVAVKTAQPSQPDASTEDASALALVLAEAEAEERKSKAVRENHVGEGTLPVDKELELTRLLSDIGSDADSETPRVVRSLATRLPVGAIVKVRESLGRPGVRNRARYAVGALRSELRPDLVEGVSA